MNKWKHLWMSYGHSWLKRISTDVSLTHGFLVCVRGDVINFRFPHCGPIDRRLICNENEFVSPRYCKTRKYGALQIVVPFDLLQSGSYSLSLIKEYTVTLNDICRSCFKVISDHTKEHIYKYSSLSPIWLILKQSCLRGVLRKHMGN